MFTSIPQASMCLQAWSVLEFTEGNYALARSMCSCAVKADPSSVRAWDVSRFTLTFALTLQAPLFHILPSDSYPFGCLGVLEPTVTVGLDVRPFSICMQPSCSSSTTSMLLTRRRRNVHDSCHSVNNCLGKV